LLAETREVTIRHTKIQWFATALGTAVWADVQLPSGGCDGVSAGRARDADHSPLFVEVDSDPPPFVHCPAALRWRHELVGLSGAPAALSGLPKWMSENPHKGEGNAGGMLMGAPKCLECERLAKEAAAAVKLHIDAASRLSKAAVFKTDTDISSLRRYARECSAARRNAVGRYKNHHKTCSDCG
jgi:hypothetical protein